MAGHLVDAEARERVGAVEAQLNAHEKYCGERWETTTAAIAKLESKVSDTSRTTHQRMDRFTYWAIAVLLSIAGFAIVQWFLFANVAKTASGG